MKLFSALIFAMIIAFFITYFFVYPDALRAAYNKCDHKCMGQRQYPILTFYLKFPPWECDCGGHRMPDDYLLKK